MAQRILRIDVDGTETTLELPLSLKALQDAVGGYIEMVRVLPLDAASTDEMTYLIVNEEGLLKGLPRNAKATQLYQHLARWLHPGASNPFHVQREQRRASLPSSFFVLEQAEPVPGYDDDPWIAGPVIYFEGYTCHEVDTLL